MDASTVQTAITGLKVIRVETVDVLLSCIPFVGGDSFVSDETDFTVHN